MRILLVLLTLCGACKERRSSTVERGPCSGPSRLELRHGDGALELRIVDAPAGGGLDLCDPAGQRLGGLGWEGSALRLTDRGGQEQLRVADAKAMEVRGPSGQALRLFRAEPTLRVLKPDGIPYGSLSQAGADSVVVSDPGGVPVAKVAPRDGDAVLISPDGTTHGYVVPSPGLLGAAAFALPELPVEQRAFLAVHLSRPRFSPK